MSTSERTNQNIEPLLDILRNLLKAHKEGARKEETNQKQPDASFPSAFPFFLDMMKKLQQKEEPKPEENNKLNTLIKIFLNIAMANLTNKLNVSQDMPLSDIVTLFLDQQNKPKDSPSASSLSPMTISLMDKIFKPYITRSEVPVFLEVFLELMKRVIIASYQRTVQSAAHSVTSSPASVIPDANLRRQQREKEAVARCSDAVARCPDTVRNPAPNATCRQREGVQIPPANVVVYPIVRQINPIVQNVVNILDETRYDNGHIVTVNITYRSGKYTFCKLVDSSEVSKVEFFGAEGMSLKDILAEVHKKKCLDQFFTI